MIGPYLLTRDQHQKECMLHFLHDRPAGEHVEAEEVAVGASFEEPATTAAAPAAGDAGAPAASGAGDTGGAASGSGQGARGGQGASGDSADETA